MDPITPGDTEEAAATSADDLSASPGDGASPSPPVVGLGGSAGAIQALREFFAAMPPRPGMAFVVVLHLSREHESMLADLLQRVTALRVMKVTGTVAMEPDTVYVVPPGKVVPAGWLVMGVPAKPVRKMSEDEMEDIRRNAREYLALWQRDYRGNPSGWPGEPRQ